MVKVPVSLYLLNKYRFNGMLLSRFWMNVKAKAALGVLTGCRIVGIGSDGGGGKSDCIEGQT